MSFILRKLQGGNLEVFKVCSFRDISLIFADPVPLKDFEVVSIPFG